MAKRRAKLGRKYLSLQDPTTAEEQQKADEHIARESIKVRVSHEDSMNQLGVALAALAGVQQRFGHMIALTAVFRHVAQTGMERSCHWGSA